MKQEGSILVVEECEAKLPIQELLSQSVWDSFDWDQCKSLGDCLTLLKTQNFDFIFIQWNEARPLDFKTLESIATNARPSSLVLLGEFNDLEQSRLWEMEAVLDCIPSGNISQGQLQRILKLGQRQQSLINARKHSDHRYERLIDLNPEPILVTEFETGIIVSVNDAFCLNLGWTKDECLGKSTLDLGIWSNYDRREKLLKAVPKMGRLTNQILSLNNKNGNSHTYKCSFTSFEDSGQHLLMGLLVDLSEFEEKQAELEAHRFAIDEHTMAVITDLDGRIKFANDNFCAITGYSKEELIGNSTRILQSGIHPASFFAELWENLSSGKVWRGNICNRHKSGKLYWLATTIIPHRNSQGQIIEYIALRTDITDLKATEQALVKSEEHLYKVINSTPHVIWAIDLNYKLRSLNNNFRAQFKLFFNYELEYGDAMDNISVFPKEFLEEWTNRYNNAFEGKVANYHDIFPNPVNGQNQHFAITVYPTLNEEGAIVGANILSQDVTERELAKTSLEESNKLLNQVQKMSGVADWSFDNEKGVFNHSENLGYVIGAKTDDAIPKSFRDLLRKAASKHHASLLQCSRKVFYHKEIGKNIWSVHDDKGHEIWLECHTFPELGEDGQLSRLIGVVRDVTDMVRLQTLEKDQKAIFAKLAASGPELLRINELQSVLTQLTKSVSNWFEEEVAVGTTRAIEAGLEESRIVINHLELPAEYHPYLQPLIDSIENLDSFPSVEETKKMLSKNLVVDFSSELTDKLNSISPLEASLIQERFPNLSLKAVGLNYNQKFQGFCFVLFPEGTPPVYSDQLLEILANQASTAMELIESRNELKENALVLNQSLEAAKSGTFRYRFDRLELVGDARFYRNLGLSEDHSEPISTEEITSRMRPEHLQLMGDLVEELNTNLGKFHYQVELELLCFDGQSRWFEDHGQVIKRDANNQVLELMGIRTDITARKQREQQLLLLESTVTNATEGILVTDAIFENGGPHIIYANKALEKMSGYSLNELIGKSPRLLQGSDTNKAVIQTISEHIRAQKPVNVELVNYHKNGTPYWVELSIFPVLNQKSKLTHFVALERDTTEEHKKRSELKELLLRLELATRANGVAVWDLDLNTQKLIWDDNMLSICGISRSEFKNTFEHWMELIHPDDRIEIESVLLNSKSAIQEDLDLRFRVLRPDGIRYIAATARFTKSILGKASRTVGICWDISEIEESRLQVEELRQNTQALINSTSNHLWSIDARFKILSANNNYIKYLDELANRSFKIGDSGLHPKLGEERNSKWQKLYQKVLGGEQINFQMEESGIEGSRIFAISLYPIFNDNGIITGVAGYSQDATDRTNHLKTIEHQNLNLKEIAWMQSHVMRAPLARILGLLELLKDERPHMNESIREIVDLVNASSEEMDQVIREITTKTERFDLNLQ